MLSFLEGLDNDIRKALMAQLRNLWTHTSTAIEGNTLTLGETAFVIEEGLTVSGKPLKDHQEVVGHARAIDLIYDMAGRQTQIIEQDLFDLHRAVQTEILIDVYRPVGAWKIEPNGTYIIKNEKQIFFEYADPEDVPDLMKEWLDLLNAKTDKNLSRDHALSAYIDLHVSFVRIHPFFDGNGRMARLISNIPVIKSGFPPIIIPNEYRRNYIMALSEYELSAGSIKRSAPLLPSKEKLTDFKNLCSESWKEPMDLVDEAWKKQADRKRS
ncbi:MAG: Fic family protein [Thermodesulfobacteriota bacterium]|nr:Fic family protein [Thermodesulfobacteriota bacterium]